MTDTISSPLAACEAEPGNWDLLLVTADALQDDGQHWLGEAFRWCGEHRKRPMFYYGLREWTWWHEKDRLENGKLDFCTLPTGTFEAVTEFVLPVHIGKFGEVNWQTFKDAMRGLASGLEHLSSQEKSGGR